MIESPMRGRGRQAGRQAEKKKKKKGEGKQAVTQNNVGEVAISNVTGQQ